jgi:endonuclease-3
MQESLLPHHKQNKKHKINPHTNSKQIFSILEKRFGKHVETPLHYKEPHELAISVILSAQCTDERVNQVTPNLFQKYPRLVDFQKAKIKDLEGLIFSTGFYHNKAKNIKGFADQVIKKFSGVIPNQMEDLIQVPGIGRKTANVILSELYGIHEGVVVDTHVKRLSNRLGLTKEKDPVKIEKDLVNLFPTSEWRNVSLYLIFHGRETCMARNPACDRCILGSLCPSFSSKIQVSKTPNQ